jgi:hypothetical protein
MASQFTIYKSTDTSAPTLSGSVGTLLTVLDAVLVNGYPGKTAAGWSKPFANSGNVGCYKGGSGSQMSLSINDNAAVTAKEARATGYESLSAVATGTNPFPTVAQSVGASVAMCIWRKSNTADGTARPWIIYADARTFYMFVQTGDSGTVYQTMGFGEFYSLKSGDSYNCFICGRTTENSATVTLDSFDVLSAIGSSVSQNFVTRAYSAAVGSITVGKHGDGVKGSTSAFLGSVPFPNNADSGVYISPVWICENSTSTVRGRLRGIWQPLHAISNFTDQGTFSADAGSSFNGKSFVSVKSTGNAGCIIVETSNTVDTN